MHREERQDEKVEGRMQGMSERNVRKVNGGKKGTEREGKAREEESRGIEGITDHRKVRNIIRADNNKRMDGVSKKQ